MNEHVAHMHTPSALTATSRTKYATIGVLLLIWAIGGIFFSLGDHPLYSPDEGRYARTTQVMLENGDLIVPHINGHPRLEKPPMVHWFQGAAMKIVGVNELGARLPSVICGALAALMIFIAGWRWRDPATGLIAVVIMMTMPLVVVVDRLSIIDPILSVFWLGATLTGFDATRPDAPGSGRTFTGLSRRASVWAFWIAVSLATLTKGPVGLLPALALLVWALGRKSCGTMRPWMWVVGMLIAVAPIVAWAIAVVMRLPDALAIWRYEILDRMAGEGDHTRPIYYYLPIFLGGLYPATALLPVIGWHFKWTQLREALRRGNLRVYLAITVIVPFVVFSLMGGKLATYLLPLAGPMALVAAWSVRDWLDVRDDHAVIKATPNHPARKLPDGITTMALVATIGWIGLMVLALTPKLMTMAQVPTVLSERLVHIIAPIGLLPLAAWVAHALWRRSATRAAALIMLAVATFSTVTWTMEFGEDPLTGMYSNRELVKQIHRVAGNEPLHISLAGYQDPTVSFYADYDVLGLSLPSHMTPEERHAPPGRRWIIAAKTQSWQRFTEDDPTFTNRFKKIGEFQRAWDKLWIMEEK